MNPNINNGMLAIQDYERLKAALEMNQTYFVIVQVRKKSQKVLDQDTREYTKVSEVKIDLAVTSLHIFYNRVLLSRA